MEQQEPLQPALRPELPRLSFPPFLLKGSSPGDVTLAPRTPSTFEQKTHEMVQFFVAKNEE